MQKKSLRVQSGSILNEAIVWYTLVHWGVAHTTMVIDTLSSLVKWIVSFFYERLEEDDVLYVKDYKAIVHTIQGESFPVFFSGAVEQGIFKTLWTTDGHRIFDLACQDRETIYTYTKARTRVFIRHLVKLTDEEHIEREVTVTKICTRICCILWSIEYAYFGEDDE